MKNGNALNLPAEEPLKVYKIKKEKNKIVYSAVEFLVMGFGHNSNNNSNKKKNEGKAKEKKENFSDEILFYSFLHFRICVDRISVKLSISEFGKNGITLFTFRQKSLLLKMPYDFQMMLLIKNHCIFSNK